MKKQRCSVVGNSPIILSSTYGNQIDSYDVVIRCNKAPTQGLEEHTGARTTIRFLNGVVARLLTTPEASYQNPQFNNNFSNWKSLRLEDVLKDEHIILKDDNPTVQEVSAVVAGKHEVTGITPSYFEKLKKLSNSSNPTAGFCAVVWASETFETVDCYGFDFYEKAQEGDTKLHYYEEVYNFKGYEWHNFQKEREVLSSLTNVTFHY